MVSLMILFNKKIKLLVGWGDNVQLQKFELIGWWSDEYVRDVFSFSNIHVDR